MLAFVSLGCGAPAAKSPPPAAAVAPEPEVAPGPGGGAADMVAAEGGGAKPQSAVVDSNLDLSGKLSQDDIRRILEKNAELFGDCYTLGAGSASKELRGTVTVKATLGPSGVVKVVEVIKSTMKNKKVDTCVADAFKKIKFPQPADAATSVITFPIKFDGVEQVQ